MGAVATSRPRRKRIGPLTVVFVVVIAGAVVWFASLFVAPPAEHGIIWQRGCAIVDLKSLGDFSFDPQSAVDASIPVYCRKLDGQRVQLEGFMWAGSTPSQCVQDFELANSFVKSDHRPPPVQERVFAHVPNGTVRYVPDLVRVRGILHVKVDRSVDGTIQSVYRLDVESIEPAAP